jgi:glycosyltransferase involved in cell wall biosynthesis
VPPPLRILVDTTACRDDRSGAARRMLELYPRVEKSAERRMEFFYLATASFAPHLREHSRDARIIDSPAFDGVVWKRMTRQRKLMRRIVDEHAIDVVFQDTLPPSVPERSWITLHDARFALPSAPILRRLYARFFLPRVLRRCAHIVVPSEFTKGEITVRLKVSPERITVVPNGVDRRFFAEAIGDSHVLERIGVAGRPFLLGVGHREPRKNVEFAVEVLAELVRRGRDLLLVWVGRPIQHFDLPEKVARSRGVFDRVIFAEDVATSELPGIYRAAEALLFPSRYEGFGLPILEAGCAGTPVIASPEGAAAVPRETVGRILSCDAVAWADAIDHLDPAIDRQTPAAIDRFSWDAAARALSEALDRRYPMATMVAESEVL